MSTSARRSSPIRLPSTTALLVITTGLLILLGLAAPHSGTGADGGSVPVTDFSDRRRLVGFVENVFVGRVVARTGTRYDIPADVRKPDDPGEPVYTIDVRTSIKGSLPDTVTLGPFDLESGQEYVFATNPSPDRSGQIVVSGYGAVPIRDASHRTKLIEDFGRAYKEEITYTRAP